MSKLTIELEADVARVFVDDKEIGVTEENGIRIIDHIEVYSDTEKRMSGQFDRGICIVFDNFLGGLFEGIHKEVIMCIRKSLKELDKLPFNVSTSMTFNLNRDRLFEQFLDGSKEPYNVYSKLGTGLKK